MTRSSDCTVSPHTFCFPPFPTSPLFHFSASPLPTLPPSAAERPDTPPIPPDHHPSLKYALQGGVDGQVYCLLSLRVHLMRRKPATLGMRVTLVATVSQDQQKQSRPPTSVIHGPTTHSLQLPAHKCERRHMRAAPALVSALSGSFGPASHGSSASAVGHFVVFV